MKGTEVRVLDEDGSEYVVRDEGPLTGGVGDHYIILTREHGEKVVGGFGVRRMDGLVLAHAIKPENDALVDRLAREFLAR